MRINFFFQGWSCQTSYPKTSEEGSFDWKSKVLVSFLSYKKIEGQLAPSHTPFPPKSSYQNFEIAILFSIVKKLNNYAFGDNITPQTPGERALSYEI